MSKQTWYSYCEKDRKFIYYNDPSVKDKIELFLTHHSTCHLGLTTLDALSMFGTTELRKIVSMLNDKDYEDNFNDKDFPHNYLNKFIPIQETNKKGKRFARYFMRSVIEYELEKTQNAILGGNYPDGEDEKIINKMYHKKDRKHYTNKGESL